jgi:NAD(P)-dependent dehydrogenase (short-subunit alcohol dehydrogenase family)
MTAPKLFDLSGRRALATGGGGGVGLGVSEALAGAGARVAVLGGPDDAEWSEAILARLPDWSWGEPADLAGSVVFLAATGSDYVHGIALPVDRGWLGR